MRPPSRSRRWIAPAADLACAFGSGGRSSSARDAASRGCSGGRRRGGRVRGDADSGSAASPGTRRVRFGRSAPRPRLPSVLAPGSARSGCPRCASSQRSFSNVTGAASCWARYCSTSSASVSSLEVPSARRSLSSARLSAARASPSVANRPAAPAPNRVHLSCSERPKGRPHPRLSTSA